MTDLLTIWLPEYFWTDSEESEAVAALECIGRRRSQVQIRGTREAFKLYRDHCESLVGPNGIDGSGYQGLKASMRATIRALERSGL